MQCRAFSTRWCQVRWPGRMPAEETGSFSCSVLPLQHQRLMLGSRPCTASMQPSCGAAVRGMSLSKNIVQLIAEDHERARSLYRQYKMPGTTASQKQMLAYTLIREVSLHSAKEEEVRHQCMAGSVCH